MWNVCFRQRRGLEPGTGVGAAILVPAFPELSLEAVPIGVGMRRVDHGGVVTSAVLLLHGQEIDAIDLTTQRFLELGDSIL